MTRHALPFLDHAEARCRPSVEPCELRHQCLRYRAAIPMHNAVLFDGMVERRNALGMLTSCAHYLPMPPDDAAP